MGYSFLGRLRMQFRAVSNTLKSLDLWMDQQVNGVKSDSGIPVTPKSALTYSAFFDGIRQISQAIASLKFTLYIKTGEKRKRPYKEHPLYNVLMFKANEDTDSFCWMESVMMNLFMAGNHYSFKIKDGGNRIVGLRQLNPFRMRVERDSERKVVYIFNHPDVGELVFQKDEIFHVKATSEDGLMGISVLELATNSIGLGLAYQKFANKFFANGAHIGGVLEYPHKLDEEGLQRIKKSWNSNYGGLNETGNTAVMENGMKFVPTAMELESAQFVEAMTFQITDTARWLNIPPHKLKELSRATFSNISEEQISYLQDTLRPWMIRIQTAIDTQLLRRDQWGTVFSEFRFEDLLRADVKTNAEALGINRINGFINREEGREKLNYDAIDDGNGEKFWQPLNMGIQGEEKEEPVEEPMEEPEDEPPEEQEEEQEEETPRQAEVEE